MNYSRGGGSLFSRGEKKFWKGVSNSSCGLPDDLSKGRGPFFSRGEIWRRKNLEGGVKNSSHGHDLSTGRGSFFSRGDIGY